MESGDGDGDAEARTNNASVTCEPSVGGGGNVGKASAPGDGGLGRRPLFSMDRRPASDMTKEEELKYVMNWEDISSQDEGSQDEGEAKRRRVESGWTNDGGAATRRKEKYAESDYGERRNIDLIEVDENEGTEGQRGGWTEEDRMEVAARSWDDGDEWRAWRDARDRRGAQEESAARYETSGDIMSGEARYGLEQGLLSPSEEVPAVVGAIPPEYSTPEARTKELDAQVFQVTGEHLHKEEHLMHPEAAAFVRGEIQGLFTSHLATAVRLEAVQAKKRRGSRRRRQKKQQRKAMMREEEENAQEGTEAQEENEAQKETEAQDKDRVIAEQ